MTEPIALIDMDGTLCDYVGAMKRDLESLAAPGEEIPEDFAENIPQHIRNRQDIIKKQPGWWRNLEPTEFGKILVAYLVELEYDNHVLTKGPNKKKITPAWTEKVDWCIEHYPDLKITITEDKGLAYGRLLADDYPPYITRWLEWRPRGLVIMPDHPHNKSFDHPNVFRWVDPGDNKELYKKLVETRNRK